MKRILFLPLLLAACCLSRAADPVPGFHKLETGETAPDFSLPGTDGKTHTLADYKAAKLLAIVFMSNHCPDSQAAEGRLKQLRTDFGSQGLTLVAINPNNPEGLREDELGYSKYNDSLAEMVAYGKEQGFDFPYLYDGETQNTAKAYGCLATPHVFIFDAARKLRYQGQLDDSRFADISTVKATPARDAVEALLADSPVPVAETKPHGCSTKWMEKKASVAQDIEKWEAKSVDVETIDLAGVKALRKNGTKKLRLINVWATTCAPCLEEFPELVRTSRKFGMRDFELITISLDVPKDLDKAKAFLEKQHAALTDQLTASLKKEGRKTNSYLYTGASQDELIQALDPEWPGPIPHSVLIAPDGTVIWRHNGVVNGEELRAKILETLGHYYVP